MARPERRDVDYFPFYVKEGKTLFILESKFGCRGTGFFTNVLRFLCKNSDHHFQIKDDADMLYFFSCCRCEEKEGLEMLDIMTKTGKLSRDLWVSYKVIVSEDLLISIKDAYRNRLGDIITMDQIIKTYVRNPGKSGITDVRNLPACELPDQNGVINTQSKVKESKVKKSKVTSDPLFDAFYSAYPKHVARDEALKAWLKLDLSNGTIEKIMTSLELHKKTTWKETQPKYIPNPASWLNGKRWNDEPIKTEENNQGLSDEEYNLMFG